MSVFKPNVLGKSELSPLATSGKRMLELRGGLYSYLNLVLLKSNIFILESLSKSFSSFFE